MFGLVAYNASSFALERPFIWVKATDRNNILNKIDSEAWAKSLLTELEQRVEFVASDDIALRKRVVMKIPFSRGSLDDKRSTLENFYVRGGNKKKLRAFAKSIQDGVDCGVLFYLTQLSKYAKCGADILHNLVVSINNMPVNTALPRKGFHNAGWVYPKDHLYEARILSAQLPIIYDFIYPYIKSKGLVYDASNKALIEFNFEAAQRVFETYIWLALNNGLKDSNWPVYESPSLVHNTLALEDVKLRKKYLSYYLETDTDRQSSLKTISRKFLQEGSIWPESFQYSKQVQFLSVYLMRLLDNFEPTLGLGKKYPNIISASQYYNNLLFANGDYPYLGDGHRTYDINYPMLEISLSLSRMHGLTKQENYFDRYLAASVEAGVYQRGILEKRFAGARPYLIPLQLLWSENKLTSDTSMNIYPKKTRTNKLDYAGISIQRNENFIFPYINSLMGVIGGASYIHGHASGISMELYGQGHVLGIDGGKGKYRTDIHENYYRLFAAHNTVISNGASASEGGWLNLGIDKVRIKSVDPTERKTAVSDDFSFSTLEFKDMYNQVAPAKHQRTLALVKLSDTKGYYIDIFRAKNMTGTENEFHDYIYRNVGDKLDITSENGAVVLANEEERYLSQANTSWVEHRKYVHPGWHFFKNIQVSAVQNKQLNMIFSANRLSSGVYMKAISPAGYEQSVASVLAPPSTAAPYPYENDKVPAFILRKQGPAWDTPFVVLYESSLNKADFSIINVELLTVNGSFKGVKVESKSGNEKKTQFILVQDSKDDIYVNESKNLYFEGEFGIVSLSSLENRSELYIGKGSTLKYKNFTISSDKNKSVSKLF